MHSHENETTHFCVVRDKDIEFDTWSHFRYSGVKLCEAKTHRNHALTQDVTSLFNNNDIFRKYVICHVKRRAWQIVQRLGDKVDKATVTSNPLYWLKQSDE